MTRKYDVALRHAISIRLLDSTRVTFGTRRWRNEVSRRLCGAPRYCTKRRSLRGLVSIGRQMSHAAEAVGRCSICWALLALHGCSLPLPPQMATSVIPARTTYLIVYTHAALQIIGALGRQALVRIMRSAVLAPLNTTIHRHHPPWPSFHARLAF